MSLGALPTRRSRPPAPLGPPPPPPPIANSTSTFQAPTPPTRHHWKSLARLEMGEMTAKNIKGSITRAFGLKSKQDKTSPSSSSESSSVISRWSRPSPPRTRSYISIGHPIGGHPPFSSLDYDSTYESPQSIYDSPLNCNQPQLQYRVSSQQSINSNIYSNGSHCFDISELESVSHRTYSQRSVNSHRVSSPLPIHEEADNQHKQKKHRRVKSIGDIEAAATLPA